MNNSKNAINAEYKLAVKTNWEGRKSNPDIENQYWHQEIKLIDTGKDPFITSMT